MDIAAIAHVRANPAFMELERKRSTLSWTLALVMMALYGGFLLLVAFGKSIAARPIGTGPLTLAFPLGIGVIVTAIVLTAIYVWRANAVFDPLIARVATEIVTRPGDVP